MYTITISGPLGSNRAILKGNEFHAEMQIQGQYIYGSPQDLSSELLGASLPLGLMRFWVTGMPAPNHSFTKDTFYKNSEIYSGFRQLDWQLDFPGTNSLTLCIFQLEFRVLIRITRLL